MSLDELVERAGTAVRTNLVEMAGAAQTALYFAGALYGEHLQNLALKGQRDYDFLQGHLSDFGAVAAETALFLGATHYLGKRAGWSERHLKFMECANSCIPVAIQSLSEISERWDKSFTFDPVDILAYVGGAAAAYGGYQLSKKVKGWWDGRKAHPEAS